MRWHGGAPKGWIVRIGQGVLMQKNKSRAGSVTIALVPPPRSSVALMEHSAAPNPTRTPFILTHFEDVPLVESWTRGGVPPSSTTSRGFAEAAVFLHGQVGGKRCLASSFDLIELNGDDLLHTLASRRGISARQRAARRARAPGGGPAGIGSARPDGSSAGSASGASCQPPAGVW
jgi:hypothetical protein